MKNNEKIEKSAGNIAKSAYEKAIEKGLKKGIEQTAMNMLKKGLDAAFISEITNLSIERINENTEKNSNLYCLPFCSGSCILTTRRYRI